LRYLVPFIQGAEFDALVADVAVNGLLEPIVMYEEQILDGRNRYRACLECGVEPRFDEYTGNDPFGHVISLNFHRRHLTASQKAIVFAKIAKLTEAVQLKIPKFRHFSLPKTKPPSFSVSASTPDSMANV
jgi:hypothetical protein